MFLVEFEFIFSDFTKITNKFFKLFDLAKTVAQGRNIPRIVGLQGGKTLIDIRIILLEKY